ncbi:hypothetical protein PF005_g21309 [Phytophthora fragariae]|uniref:Uncharacterized protein n=1 Tax=Phytophthora fragariae TaxID=53985 RepID=A0A6A3EFG9_9STRA|nr:hypothetical protein PF003_g667 [Phytophthora fragariae]KAE8930996.1 hypothetical protein PF009_g18930 [Phytophthora fragariae]KAE9018943.1 hypothetical protein PF011_g6029 [Phytophthora fragariae]KAE9087857.1 hypothetical protein PF010_g19573 [Phytophthora fragariae]KAE9093135.1 hypothetical protein PF007_g18224 [Phytophthora fragariae]
MCPDKVPSLRAGGGRTHQDVLIKVTSNVTLPNGLTLPQPLAKAHCVESATDEPSPALVKFEKLLSRQKLLQPELKKAKAHCVESATDEPSPALVKFEKLLSRQKLLQPELKKALDKLCLDTMRSFTRASQPKPRGGWPARGDPRRGQAAGDLQRLHRGIL